MGSSSIIRKLNSYCNGPGKSKIQDSVQLQENIRNNGQPSYSRLRRHIDQVNEDKKFQIPERNSGKRDSDQESQRGEESGENAISGKQRDSVPKETHVVPVTNSHLETDAGGGEKEQSSSPAPKAKAQTDGQIPSQAFKQ